MSEQKKLKRGQRPEGWKNNCPKFKEYYAALNPNWSDQECVEAARKYCRSINWQCIEFYSAKYPEKTLEECEELRKEAIFNKRSNSRQHIEYYQKRFPEASEEEQLEMLNNAKKNYLAKRPDNSGENNPAHRSKTSSLERRQRSPKCIEFYQLKYPGLSMREYKNMVNEHKKLTASRLTPEKHSTKIEYWLAKGYTEEEAKIKLSQRQRTFDLKYCINKYGEGEGKRIFEERQIKWRKSFQKTKKNAITNGIQSSNIADNFFNLIESIKGGEREVINGRYSFDYMLGDKIIEFNGDYWHANPKIYKKDYINKTLNLTAYEIWKKDEKRKKYIQKQGYQLYVVWESDYKNDPENTIKKCLQFLTS